MRYVKGMSMFCSSNIEVVHIKENSSLKKTENSQVFLGNILVDSSQDIIFLSYIFVVQTIHVCCRTRPTPAKM